MNQTREQIRTSWWSDEVMYWLEDQVTVAFQSPISLTGGGTPPKQDIINSLHLENLNQFLKVRGLELQSYTLKDVPHPVEENFTLSEDHFTELNSTIGKYMFPLPGSQETLVVGFFNLKQVETVHATQDIETIQALSRNSAVQCRCESDSNTRKAVDLINSSLKKLKEDAKVPVLAAAPNWLGGANCYIHGCPVFPPLPVPEGDSCSTSPGYWHIQVPAISSESSPIHEMTGAGVTVFVLDSMPDIKDDPDLIKKAAARAGDSNKLLREIADQQDRAQLPFIKFSYQDLPDTLKEDALDQLVTGRDLKGKLYGFSMPDHGLFVTGMIRDLICEANIEYVRVLNDFGVSSVSIIIKALEDIQNRMMPVNPNTGEKGDLYNKPVGINLSLVLTPPETDLLQLWFGVDPAEMGKMANTKYDSTLLRLHLHKVIQSLAESGAVIVASAGNDSNWSDMPGRMEPRYPAAFEEVLSVGAVDKDQNAARYSNYPQANGRCNGIATYGGTIPTLKDIQDDDVDAMRGVYSEILFPIPIADNTPPLEYDPQDPIAWAYWSGTSFATPIISAVAARILQLKAGEWSSNTRVPGVHRALLTPEGQQELLTGDDPLPTQSLFNVPLLMAYQCKGVEEVREYESVTQGGL